MTIFATYPPLNKWKINFDKPEIHMCNNNCFYRLINKQITSNHNFGIPKVCNMDQEAEIFKPRGSQNNFLTLSTARGRPVDRGSHIGSANNKCGLVISESHSEHKSIEGMRTSCSPNINEVSGLVKYKNKQYRSRYDIHVICVNRT